MWSGPLLVIDCTVALEITPCDESSDCPPQYLTKVAQLLACATTRVIHKPSEDVGPQVARSRRASLLPIIAA